MHVDTCEIQIKFGVEMKQNVKFTFTQL